MKEFFFQYGLFLAKTLTLVAAVVFVIGAAAAVSKKTREAGGLVADIDASDNYLESGNIVCGNAKCFKAVLQVVQCKLLPLH